MEGVADAVEQRGRVDEGRGGVDVVERERGGPKGDGRGNLVGRENGLSCTGVCWD